MKPRQPHKNGKTSSHDASVSDVRSITTSEGRDEQADAQQYARSDSHGHAGAFEDDNGSMRGLIEGDHSESAASAVGDDTDHTIHDSRLDDDVGNTRTNEESREFGAQDSAEVPVMAAELSPTTRDVSRRRREATRKTDM